MGHSLPRPEPIFKGCPYVQDTDEKLAPLGQNPKRTVAYSTLPKRFEIPPKTKSNLINPRNKPGKPQSQNPNPQPFPASLYPGIIPPATHPSPASLYPGII